MTRTSNLKILSSGVRMTRSVTPVFLHNDDAALADDDLDGGVVAAGGLDEGGSLGGLRRLDRHRRHVAGRLLADRAAATGADLRSPELTARQGRLLGDGERREAAT